MTEGAGRGATAARTDLPADGPADGPAGAPDGTPRASLAVGATLALIGLGGVLASLGIELDRRGGWGARLFPLAASAALVALGALEALGARSARREARPDDGGRAARGRAQRRRAGAVLALLGVALGYVWLIGRVGYLPSTAIAAPLALWTHGVRSGPGLLAAAILCPLAYHLVFFVGLGVFPPYGEWFDLLDLIEGH